MNTFIITRKLVIGTATASQEAIYTAHAERPATITAFRVFNSDATARWVRAWMNGAQICDETIAAKSYVDLVSNALGLQEGESVEIQGEIDAVLLWQLHGQGDIAQTVVIPPAPGGDVLIDPASGEDVIDPASGEQVISP